MKIKNFYYFFGDTLPLRNIELLSRRVRLEAGVFPLCTEKNLNFGF